MTRINKPFRAVGAAVTSALMVGVFALPAYASNSGLVEPDVVYSQVLQTGEFVEIAVPAETPAASLKPVVAPFVEASDLPSPGGWKKDAAPSATALKLVAAARAQLGVGQDCTDLVQNSLAAIGLTERRDQGGYDHGTGSLAAFGTPITNGEWAPGDILGWPGYPHVALYIGNGLAVHGGMGGSTVVAPATGHFGTPSYVVRPA